MSDTQLASSTIDGTLGSSGGDHGREKEWRSNKNSIIIITFINSLRCMLQCMGHVKKKEIKNAD